MDVKMVATIAGGLSWTIAYISAISASFRDQTYGMPVVALALNFSWEVIWTFKAFYEPPSLHLYVTLLWGLTDIGLIVCYLSFGRSEFGPYVTRPIFVVASALLFVVAFALQEAFIVQLGASANLISAFLQNALMSWLFISMFFARCGTRGQTLTVAVFKCIGTLAPTILFGFIYLMPLIIVLGMICFVLDVVYIGLVAGADGGGIIDWCGVPENAARGSHPMGTKVIRRGRWKVGERGLRLV